MRLDNDQSPLGRGGPGSQGGPEGCTVWKPRQPRKTGCPESPGRRPAPRSVLSPPGLSSSFNASKISSRPQVSRAPQPAACGGAAMTGMERATCNPVAQAPQQTGCAAMFSVAGGAGRWGRGQRQEAGLTGLGAPALHKKNFFSGFSSLPGGKNPQQEGQLSGSTG